MSIAAAPGRGFPVIIVCNLVYAIVLLVLALIPVSPQVIPKVHLTDTVAHAAVYGLQAGMMLWLLKRMLTVGKAFVFAWLGATLYGLVTELAQLLVAARSFEVSDMVADAVGAALVLAAVGTVQLMIGWVKAARSRRRGAGA
jgi:VanZ family protein